MDTHLPEERLNDLVDGLLSAEQRTEAEAHLMACAECRGMVEDLQDLLAGLGALPRAISPGVDLRPGIHARIHAAPQPARRGLEARTRALWTLRYPLAAAAVALVLLSSGITVWLLRDEWTAPAATATATEQFRDLEGNYLRASAELLQVLAAERSRLDPATLELVIRNLQVIDGAIRESRAALAKDPHSELLRRMLMSSYAHKLEILRRATTTPGASS